MSTLRLYPLPLELDTPPRRLSDVDLFRIGPKGLEDISDDTLRFRLGYAEAVEEEMLQTPEAAP
jgi:hypothetical protein